MERSPLPGRGSTTSAPFHPREALHATPDDRRPPRSPPPPRSHASGTGVRFPGAGRGADSPHARPPARWIGRPPQPMVAATGGQAGRGGRFPGQHRPPPRWPPRRRPPLRLRSPRAGRDRSGDAEGAVTDPHRRGLPGARLRRHGESALGVRRRGRDDPPVSVRSGGACAPRGRATPRRKTAGHPRRDHHRLDRDHPLRSQCVGAFGLARATGRGRWRCDHR